MQRESVFLMYVRHTFKRWAGFQAALDEGMGGIYAKEKELWMGTEVENYFKLYDDVKPEDLEDYLGTMLENEFDTYFEDNSLLEVSKKCCAAYPLALVNPNAEIFQEVLKEMEVQSRPSKESETPSGPIGNEEEVACEKLKELSVNKEIEEDGWTTVSKKKK